MISQIDVLNAIRPGRGYSVSCLNQMLHCSTNTLKGPLSAAVMDGKLEVTKRPENREKLYWIKGTVPKPREPSQPKVPDFLARGTLTGYEAELFKLMRLARPQKILETTETEN